ncbi:MAG: hypothetical protein HY335_11330 [Deinococcus sp.]|nr:hypothetical protein [Deinococcus sp.]
MKQQALTAFLMLSLMGAALAQSEGATVSLPSTLELATLCGLDTAPLTERCLEQERLSFVLGDFNLSANQHLASFLSVQSLELRTGERFNLFQDPAGLSLSGELSTGLSLERSLSTLHTGIVSEDINVFDFSLRLLATAQPTEALTVRFLPELNVTTTAFSRAAGAGASSNEVTTATITLPVDATFELSPNLSVIASLVVRLEPQSRPALSLARTAAADQGVLVGAVSQTSLVPIATLLTLSSVAEFSLSDEVTVRLNTTADLSPGSSLRISPSATLALAGIELTAGATFDPSTSQAQNLSLAGTLRFPDLLLSPEISLQVSNAATGSVSTLLIRLDFTRLVSGGQ